MTWLMFVNVFFFQWFFVRLAKNVSTGEPGEGPKGSIIDWRFIGPIVPTTGWSNDYIWLGSPFNFILTRKQ